MLLERLRTVCASAPHEPAVVAGADRWTYGDLEKGATRVAKFLVTEADVRGGERIAVYGPRTADTLVCMLGIMASGAAYTVVEDDGKPVENQHRLQAIDPSIVLCESIHVAMLRKLGLRAFDAAVALRWTGDAALPEIMAAGCAYVLFTSGTTGTPKGVAVTHGNIAHYTAAIADRLNIGRGLRYAHVSTLAADLGNTSLFLSLATGGCLHLLDGDLRKDPASLRDYLVRHEIAFLKITPSHWNAIFSSMTAQHHARSSLQHLVLGGEILSVGLARRILQSRVVRTLTNHYGPTETTVGVTVFPILNIAQLDAMEADSVPIGRPLGDTLLRVRSDDGTFTDRNARGELYIGGPSVSDGYVGDAAGTARSFVMLGTEGRFYKTGDQVSIDDSGIVSFHGRVDRQVKVKVNGHRVELESIEAVLRTLTDVKDAALFFSAVRGKERIVAALLGSWDAADFGGVRGRLAAVMPEYMIPKFFLAMEDFPRNANGKTDMKALQVQVLQRLAAEAGTGSSAAAAAADEPGILKDLRSLWRTYLRDVEFDDDDNFFEKGGDSLDAIQLIADIQVQGHRVTAKAFLKNPTLRGLMSVLDNAAHAPVSVDKAVTTVSRILSPAQDFFFRQSLTRPNFYNQAVLLACGTPVNVDVMREAILLLLEGHPSLRTAHATDAQGRFARLIETRRGDVLGFSSIPEHASEAEFSAFIQREAQAAHRMIHLSDGSLFRAHVFKSEARGDQLLLVAHHVAVDVISWRILVADLSRLYSDLQAGRSAGLPPNPHSFWEWAGHLASHRSQLHADAATWLEAQAEAQPPVRDPSNTEGAARTVWMNFTHDETVALTNGLTAHLAVPFHVILLAALAQGLARSQRTTRVRVDVESHGRVVFDDSIDISRVVGWHTSTFPLALQVNPLSLGETVAWAAHAMSEVPDLGVSHGVMASSGQRSGKAEVSAPVCFNYLGEINFNHDPRFPLKPSSYPLDRARADDNHRGHDLKFTARLIDGNLIVDLSFPGSADSEAMQGVMHGIKSDLLALTGQAAPPPALVVEPGTRTGLLTDVPRHLLAPPGMRRGRRKYGKVLLTGASGYIGVHVLMELLQKPLVQVVCVVRAKDGMSPLQRLSASFDWYFPEAVLSSFGDRVSVLAGDLSRPQFDWSPAQYEGLSASIDAIYHFAADTRLFGPEEEFRRNNVQSIRTCIAFAQHRRPKDLHYMSTLAVSGVNPRQEPIVFSEDSMDIGQEFQNFYESSKYEAEFLVRNFELMGHAGFVYRSGNVSAHSRTARFQRNAADNRFVQFLAACVKVGKLPRQLGEAIALSPVDEVAAGIVAISMDEESKGGVFHVDTAHETSMRTVFETLQRQGLALQESQHDSFASVFGEVRNSADPDLALGYFWATRKPRNVRYSHERTHQVLCRLGLSFEPVSADWLHAFVRSLSDQGIS